MAQDENAVCDKACGELLEILATRPGEPPLLMVLDHLEKIFENDLHRLSDKLLWPIACGRLDHVYVIATVSDEALKDSRLGDAAAKGEWLSRVDQIEIDFFKPRQAMPLGREFGARKGWIADPKWQSWLEGNPRMQESAWPPAELLRVADAYEAFGGFR